MKQRFAFTMVELIMVIVVFGIVASIGAEIITSLYNNYLRTRAINQLQGQTEIVLEQIAKRLQYRIKDSVRVTTDDGATWRALPDAIQTVAGDHTIVEWIGISNESFLGDWNGTANVPGWSGLIDMEHANTREGMKTLETPGSHLDFARTIIQALTDNVVDMNNENGNLPALIFKGAKPLFDVNKYYSQGTNNYTVRIANDTNTSFHIPTDDNLTDFDQDGIGNGDLFEQYYLSHSAYAIMPDSPSATDFTLLLQYNYQPWQGDTYPNAPQTILAEHVSTFRIRQEGNVVRIKLCIHDNNQSGDFDFSACKEKVIY